TGGENFPAETFLDTTAMESSILVFSDHVLVPVSAVMSAISELGVRGDGQNPLILTQASYFLEEISRVLKPRGTVLIQAPQPATTSTDKVKASKPSWKIGSSFSIKKATPIFPKVQQDDDLDLIDEDSLLTEEDLKKPELPVVDDCEVGSSKKACKNCTCGRAEAEEKVVELGLTEEQIENPQSVCGSCGLGDAFRCASCPYKGLLAFKLGEKVSLSSNFLVSDF
ncbi:hypothetical protein MKX01_004031, partial [Papaver californicum]